MAAPKPKTLSVKLRTGTVERARIVVALEGGATLTDLLSDILDPILVAREREAFARRAREIQGEGGLSGKPGRHEPPARKGRTRLGPIERAEIMRLAGEGIKQQEIAARFGVGQSAVSRVLARGEI